MNGYHKKVPGRCDIKVHLMKANDSVDWKIILRYLSACGILEKFVH